MEITNEDIVAALEGRPSKRDQHQRDKTIAALEGKPAPKPAPKKTPAEIQRDDNIAALEGRQTTTARDHQDAIVRALEGKDTTQDSERLAQASLDLAVEAYAEALARRRPSLPLEKTRKQARETAVERLGQNRYRHKTPVERLRAVTAYIGDLADKTSRN